MPDSSSFGAQFCPFISGYVAVLEDIRVEDDGYKNQVL
jgi:hypothetical protein